MTTILLRAILIVAASLGALTSNAASPATFNVPPRDFLAQLDSIAVGDFNRDGILDIAGSDRDTNQVSVYLGEGNGRFSPATPYQVGVDSQIAIADINGDGNLDIVTADSLPGSISILFGTGAGTFGAPLIVSVTGGPDSVAIGDLNGDGHPDIVVSSVSGAISLLLSSADGGFQPPQQFTLGGHPEMVNLADFNGDGKLDIAIFDNGSAYLFFGNGDGTFHIGPSTHIGSQPFAFSTTDLNGDGFADIVAPNHFSPGALIVLLGRGDGTFQPPVDYPTLSYPLKVAFGDFNGDGKVDVIATSSNVTNAAGIAVSPGNGDGTFGAPLFSVAPTGADIPVVGDFTGDGNLDVAILSNNYLSILRGEDNGYFVNPPHYNLAKNAMPIASASADLNGDGKPDLVTATNFGTNALWISVGNGDSTFQPAAEIPLEGAPSSLAVADFNNDGRLDIAVVMSNAGASYWVQVFLGNGNGTFQTPFSVASADVMGGIATGDFNHDGNPDIAISTGNSVLLFPGNGDGTFRTKLSTAVPEAIEAFTIGDFNHDGNLDLAGVSQASKSQAVVDVLLGTGDGRFHAPALYIVGKGAVSIVAADLNGDGDLDLATSNMAIADSIQYPGTVSVLIGNPDGTFQHEISYFAGANPTSIGVADVNGDGFPDLIATNYLDGNLVIFLGKGDGTFAPQVGRFGTGYQPQSLVIADFNGDGKPDIAVANQGSISVLTNMTSQ